MKVLRKSTKVLLGTLLVLIAARIVGNKTRDIYSTSVMITTSEQNHGGTGIILRSSSSKSEVLTNAHVCEVVKNGGLVLATTGNYPVNSVRISEVSDLCILTVLDNLHFKTKVAKYSPSLYDHVMVSGHPALMPNIVSEGHLSGEQVIQVITGLRPCTDLDNPLVCAFLGGIPIVKSFQSRLVSATIMPGSSGSGVYNSNRQLIGVVFAGSGDFGYGWTVPFEQVTQFLNVESNKIPESLAKQEYTSEHTETKNKIRKAIEKCNKTDLTDKDVLKEICSIITRDNTWYK